MSEPFLGEIKMVGFNFNPRGWAFCDGQLLPIAQNSALFSLLGTTYGGDGRTTFALPDLRGRVALHPGSGPGLPTYRQGERSGNHQTTLTAANLAPHTHLGRLKASGDAANTNNPNDNALALAEAYSDQALAASSPKTKSGTVETDSTGGGQAFSNMPP
jgi:microcystin-dependent protein